MHETTIIQRVNCREIQGRSRSFFMLRESSPFVLSWLFVFLPHSRNPNRELLLLCHGCHWRWYSLWSSKITNPCSCFYYTMWDSSFWRNWIREARKGLEGQTTDSIGRQPYDIFGCERPQMLRWAGMKWTRPPTCEERNLLWAWPESHPKRQCS